MHKESKNEEGKTEYETRPLHHQIRFIDSFKFMAAGLDKLVNNLPKDAFSNVKRYYAEDKLSLLTRKGIYLYEYMDLRKKLKETQLPPKEAFYSRLNNEGISDGNYAHAQKVRKTFEMKNLEDYHNLYNQVDVLLLSDVFENFRNICCKHYNLDPAHYFTARGLAWDAALKVTEVELELLSDPDMLLMREKGIRGGVSMISNRYGKSNNRYMGDRYDTSKPTFFYFAINGIINVINGIVNVINFVTPLRVSKISNRYGKSNNRYMGVRSDASKPAKYITYLDANNLYGWAMSKPLPTQGFKWMEPNELENWRNYSCILNVDLEYPRSLHDLHNDDPLAPEQMKIHKVKKLIPNLGDKEKYVLQYENLEQYESLGLKIKKIHRGIRFEESQWLEKYIALNTKLRTTAANEFEKDFFNLMNNSVFDKTMENIRNRVDIKLVNDKIKCRT